MNALTGLALSVFVSVYGIYDAARPDSLSDLAEYKSVVVWSFAQSGNKDASQCIDDGFRLHQAKPDAMPKEVRRELHSILAGCTSPIEPTDPPANKDKST